MVRIFTEFAEGKSPRKIAIGLSRDGIPTPKGDCNWGHQSLKQARSGILQNELYIGKFVWNRRHNDRNPDTGKISKPAASPDDLIVTDVPHMRIIDQRLWDKTREILEARSPTRPAGHVVERTEHLLGGLLQCGACGGHMRIAKKSRAGHQLAICAAADARNACSNSRSYNMETLRLEIINGIEKHLMDPSHPFGTDKKLPH